MSAGELKELLKNYYLAIIKGDRNKIEKMLYEIGYDDKGKIDASRGNFYAIFIMGDSFWAIDEDIAKKEIVKNTKLIEI